LASGSPTQVVHVPNGVERKDEKEHRKTKHKVHKEPEEMADATSDQEDEDLRAQHDSKQHQSQLRDWLSSNESSVDKRKSMQHGSRQHHRRKHVKRN
jgi:hypothetical protein